MANRKGSKLTVESNKTFIQETQYDESNGPYHTWRERKGINSDREPATANPDTLADAPENRLWGAGPSNELAERFIERYADALGNFPVLSKRQNEVLRLTLMGMSVTEVGIELKLDPRRVSTYLKRIQKRLKRLIKTL